MNTPPTVVPPAGARELFESHFSFVWRNLRRLGLDAATADDAAQDVFLVVHRRWESYDARWSSLETWLFGILLRVARSHRRSWFRYERWLDRARPSSEMETAASSKTPEESLRLRQQVLLLESLLNRLTPKERELFVMVEIEQFSTAEAAEALGVNANTAYSRLRKARDKIQEALPSNSKEAPHNVAIERVAKSS